ncbi:hypothetical protein BCR42DRAFT_427321 [Absidia repens]|uniref:Uncharacterized protein n=1 Tax=Absidia repens TaxID=90262 RepID=A0A1X2HZN0_9FUNG|nr:hypothetical protein BCR42DRAFT_427321 [Absidia repens]
MMKSIFVILCIAVTMTIADPISILLYYPGQPQPISQPVPQCFPVANAAGQLPKQASSNSRNLFCSFYMDKFCNGILANEMVRKNRVDLSKLPISSSTYGLCELSDY